MTFQGFDPNNWEDEVNVDERGKLWNEQISGKDQDYKI